MKDTLIYSIVNTLSKEISFVVTRFNATSPFRVLTSLTAIIYLSYFGLGNITDIPETFHIGAISIIIVSIGLFLQTLLRKPLFWLALGLNHFLYIYMNWTSCDNHHYLWGYWILAIWVAHLGPKKHQLRILQFNASLLVGLVMLFAVIQKAIAPDYLNGGFFYYTFLTDSRFSILETIFPFNLKDALIYNRDVLDVLRLNAESITLRSPSPYLHTVSLFISWFTIFIESLVAICFLAPKHWLLGKLRNSVLIIFALSVYPLVPVPGFASILILMGYTQSSTDPSQKRFHITYFLFLIYIYIFGLWVKQNFLL